MSKALTEEQQAVLVQVAKQDGRNWKTKLLTAWLYADYSAYSKEIQHILAQLRNTIGPIGLRRLKLS